MEKLLAMSFLASTSLISVIISPSNSHFHKQALEDWMSAFKENISEF